MLGLGAVALVVAESRALAEDACDLVEVDYEELPALVSAEAAIDPSRARDALRNRDRPGETR